MHIVRRLLAAAAVLAFAGTASAQPIVVKFSFVNPADSPKGKASEYWKKVLRKTHAQMGDRISQPMLQAIYKETGAGKP